MVADIGTPMSVLDAIGPTMWEYGPRIWLDSHPWPEPEGYKYKRGEALVLGGGAITGASRMTVHAASRAGAGMVTADPLRREFSAKLTKKQVMSSPDIDTQRPVSRQSEAHIYGHYGWYPYWGYGLYMGAYSYGSVMGSPYLARGRSTR